MMHFIALSMLGERISVSATDVQAAYEIAKTLVTYPGDFICYVQQI